MASVVPQVVQRIKRDHPALVVEIRDGLSREVVQLVSRGDADFGIGPRPLVPDLAFEHVLRDHYVVAVPPGHPLANRDKVSLNEVKGFPLVAMRHHSNARQVLERAVQDRGQPVLRPSFEVHHLFSIGRLVEAGVGIAVLPQTAIPLVAGAQIVTVAIRPPGVFRDIGFITRREYQYSPAARTFVTIFKSLIAALPARSPVHPYDVAV